MDDTLWFASSLIELQSIISAATSFYQMADIQINPTKSIFCSNQKNTTSISYFNQILPLLPFNQPFKFLGCWFTLDNKNTKQIKLIQLKHHTLYKLLILNKLLTNKLPILSTLL